MLLGNEIPTATAPRGYRFLIDLGANNEGPDGNPAKTFKLVDAALLTKEQLGPLADSKTWSDVLAVCRQDADTRRRTDPSDDRVVLPAVFVVLDVSFSTWHFLPIYLGYSRIGDALGEPLRAAVEDTLRMSAEAMEAGDVFRKPQTQYTREPTPEVGDFVKRGRKKWEWERRRDEAAYWDALAGRMSRSGSAYRSGLHPSDVWHCFHRLVN